MNSLRLLGRTAAVCAVLGSFGCNGNGGGGSNSVADGCNGLPVAPSNERVDLYRPVFSNPTLVTNPLFPISQLHSALLLGKVEGDPLRIETTLLPTTRLVSDGKRPAHQVEVLESQFVAFRNGRMEEVAIDLYAQDDLGAVWYFGEDVFNYGKDGKIADTEGTWHSGNDGASAAMIMPANPQPGDVYRPENLCGVVFEEVTVMQTGVTVDGPSGRVTGAMIASELHDDGTREDKTFAPGYGEFTSGKGDDIESLALAIPTDAIASLPPPELDTLAIGSAHIFETASLQDWPVLSTNAASLNVAWKRLTLVSQIPPLLETQMGVAIFELENAIVLRNVSRTRHAAIEVARATYDLRLRHQPPAEVDRVRFDLWLAQLQVDAADLDSAGIRSDTTALEWTWNRIEHTFASGDAEEIGRLLVMLRVFTNEGDVEGSGFLATQLRAKLAGRGW